MGDKPDDLTQALREILRGRAPRYSAAEPDWRGIADGLAARLSARPHRGGAMGQSVPCRCPDCQALARYDAAAKGETT